MKIKFHIKKSKKK